MIGGESGHRKHGLVGDTVNLAARLQTAAPVGQVVVGEGTQELLPPGALVERLPLLRGPKVKSKKLACICFIRSSNGNGWQGSLSLADPPRIREARALGVRLDAVARSRPGWDGPDRQICRQGSSSSQSR